MDPRQKAKDLMTLALDERTPEKERLAAAFGALKVIEKNALLDSPFDGIDNESVRAAVDIANRTIFDADFKRNARKVGRSVAEKLRGKRR